MKLLIIEDEPLVARDLGKLLQQLEPAAEVLPTLSSVEEAMHWFAHHPQPDLIFSDIQLSDGVSFDIFGKLDLKAPIIFTTAYNDYAIRAFKLNSIDYLLKPIDPVELKAALTKYKAGIKVPGPEQILQALSGIRLGNSQFKDRFMAHKGSLMVQVNASRVAAFQKAEAILLHTVEGEILITDYHSLDELESLLDPDIFFRANRQFIVQLSALDGYKSHYSGKLELKWLVPVKEEVTISKEKAHTFRLWMEGMR